MRTPLRNLTAENFHLHNKTEALTIYELVAIHNACFCVYNFHVPKNKEASTHCLLWSVFHLVLFPLPGLFPLDRIC